MNLENLKIQSEDDYQIMVELLDVLIDNIGQNEIHNLLPLMEDIGAKVSEYEAQEINPDNPFYDALDDVYNLAMDAHNFYKSSHLYVENGIVLQEQKNALAIVHDYLINHPLAD